MIETIRNDGAIVAIVIYSDYSVEGIKFISPNDFSLQLGTMSRPVGYKVLSHIHNFVERHCVGT